MKTKLTFLLSLTFLFLFSGSVYGNDFQDGLEALIRNDYKEAVRLWKPLAEQGDARAQFSLGYMYSNGQGVPQDYKEAVRLYRLSAEQGNAYAQNSMGNMYVKGQGVPQDYKQAIKWYRLSADKGFALAQNNLARMYYLGLGVPQDYVLAHMWVNLAASNGDEDAMKKRTMVEKAMSPSQIEKAQEMARNWKPKK